MTHRPAVALTLALLAAQARASQAPPPSVAPGAPGAAAFWTNANKQGVGTAVTLDSKVWFTLGDGGLSEIYYPRVDTADTRRLELLVADGRGLVERETEDAQHRVELVDERALAYRQINTARSGRWRTTKTTFTDPRRSAVVVQVRFERLSGAPLRLFVFFDPAVANSGGHDHGEVRGNALVTADGALAVALAARPDFRHATTGYLDASDGMAELRAGRPLPAYTHSGVGNVAQLAEIALPQGASEYEFTLALGFADGGVRALDEARAALSRPAADTLREFVAGWSEYLAGVRQVRGRHAALYAMAAMQLKAHEDKTVRGAMVASLTKPWGDEAPADDPTVGGYHLVWSRDLYQVATAFQAMGDSAAAERALEFLFKVQQRPDGSFPQNSWLDGRPYWTSLQLDEVAYPLILAHELGRADAETYRRHVKPAAEFIVAHGPATPQERWEEEQGYSPSTLAAEIAGLVAAAALAERNGDAPAAARWRATAREWADNVEAWTVTRTGPHAPEPYFLRLSQNGRPDSGALLEINNGAGTFDERTIVDAGFLELVRLGIRAPDDPTVVRSLAVVDRLLRVETPRGPAFYRYNHDGYGERRDGRGYDNASGIGRLWVLLAGERGEYELAAGRDPRPWLEAMAGFANEGRLLPEQVWDRVETPRAHLRFGAGTGSATPLAWSCAQFVRLALGIEEGRVLGRPEVVRRFFTEAKAEAGAK